MRRKLIRLAVISSLLLGSSVSAQDSFREQLEETLRAQKELARSAGTDLEYCRKTHFFYNGGEILARCTRNGKIITDYSYRESHVLLGHRYLKALNGMSDQLAKNTNSTVAVDVVLVSERAPIVAKIGFIGLNGTKRKAVFINPKYKMNDFVLAHELAHWALGHSINGATKEQELKADYWGGYIYGLGTYGATIASGSLGGPLSKDMKSITDLEPTKSYVSRWKRIETALEGCKEANTYNFGCR